MTHSHSTRDHEGVRTGARAAVSLVVVVLAVLLDQVTKAWALDHLETGTSRPLLGDVITLQLVHNSGAAFSLGSGTTWVFTILATCIVGVIIWLLPRTRDLPTLIALCLLAGGAIGNLIDRLLQPPSFGQGHVVDFINYAGFFVGNVADIWIVGAAIWLALMFMLGSHSRPAQATTVATSGPPAPTPADDGVGADGAAQGESTGDAGGHSPTQAPQDGEPRV